MLAKWLKIETAAGRVMKWLLLALLFASPGGVYTMPVDGKAMSQASPTLAGDEAPRGFTATSNTSSGFTGIGAYLTTNCGYPGEVSKADSKNCTERSSRTTSVHQPGPTLSNRTANLTSVVHQNRTSSDEKPVNSSVSSVVSADFASINPEYESNSNIPTPSTSDLNPYSVNTKGESENPQGESVIGNSSDDEDFANREMHYESINTTDSPKRTSVVSRVPVLPNHGEKGPQGNWKSGDAVPTLIDELSKTCANCTVIPDKSTGSSSTLNTNTQNNGEKQNKHTIVTTPKPPNAQSHQNQILKNTSVSNDAVSTQHPFTRNTTNNSNKTSNIPVPSKDTYPHQNDPPWHSGPNVGTDREKRPQSSDKTLVPNPKIGKGVDMTVESSHPFVKPGPDWQIAKITWGVAWEFHIYFTGVLFVFISIYSLVNILRLQSFARLISHGYFLSLNFMIFLVCSVRAVYLLHDAYNSKNTYPVALSYFLLTIPYPVLSSAFAVLFLALLQATRVQMVSPRIQKPTVLGGVILFYVSFSTTTDILAGSFFGSQLLTFVCQVLFMTWSCTVSIAYFFVFRRLYIAALRKQGEMIRITFTQMHIDGATLPKKLPKPTLGLAVKVALIIAILELFMAALQIYGMIFVYGIFVPIKPDPWPWWAYQMTSRMLEISMCCLMAFVTTQPLRHAGGGMEEGKCHRVFLWMPCNICPGGCCQGDPVDVEAFSSFCSRHRGFHNGGFHTSVDGSRRWLDQTNSLPVFPTYAVEQDEPFSLKNIPTAGKSEIMNNPSVGSLLSTFRSNRNTQAPVNAAEGSNTAQRVNQSTLSSNYADCRSTSSRPTSMLFKDKGFVRFRTEHDPEQPMDLSDDEEESSNSEDEMDSVRANASSSIPTLCEDDIVHSSLSPFYYSGFHPRFHRMSRCSLETTDNSVEVSSDQLSNVTSRNGLSNSALDFHMRKYGSTCSSESAANSFDVTFFLHAGSAGLTPNHSSHACRSELDDDTFVDPHDAALRSVSPLISRVRRVQQVPRDLNITPNSECCGQVNVACGTEDITPDSAVVMDVQFSEASGHSHPPVSNDPSTSVLHTNSPVNSPTCNKSSIISHSLNDLSYPTLRVSSSDSVLRTKRASRSFLNRLKGSSFSLNASLNGYEPLECDGSGSSIYYDNSRRRKVYRSASDRQSNFSIGGQRSGLTLGVHHHYEPLKQGRLREADSGMIRDCADTALCVDKASQTDAFLDDGHSGAHMTGIQCNLSKIPSISMNRAPPIPGNFPTLQEAL